MGLKAHLKKKKCYSLRLKCIIAEKIYTLYWTLMCENKSFKLFILFKNLINVWGATHGSDTNTSAKIMFF